MDIVEELRQNRESGAKRLVSEYKAGLMSLARRFYKNESDAEELVNATFAKVIENIDDYLEQSAFFAWMCQILTNEFKDSVRRKSSRMEIYPGVLPDIADEVAQEAIFRDVDHSLLRDAVRQLPDDQRELLLLHYFMDMPVAKIAKFLSIPNGTVFSRLHYARKALAAKLGVKAKEAVQKPGVKALLIALTLCALTALGAGVWNLAVSGEAQNHAGNGEAQNPAGNGEAQNHAGNGEAQNHDVSEGAQNAAASGDAQNRRAAAQEQQADNSKNAAAVAVEASGQATGDRRQTETSTASSTSSNSQGEQNMNTTTVTRTIAAATMALAVSSATRPALAAPSGSYLCYKPASGQTSYPWETVSWWYTGTSGSAPNSTAFPTTSDNVYLYSSKNDVSSSSGRPMVVGNGVTAETRTLTICDSASGNNARRIGIEVQNGGTMVTAGKVFIGDVGSGNTGGGALRILSGGTWTAKDNFFLAYSGGFSSLDIASGGTFSALKELIVGNGGSGVVTNEGTLLAYDFFVGSSNGVGRVVNSGDLTVTNKLTIGRIDGSAGHLVQTSSGALTKTTTTSQTPVYVGYRGTGVLEVHGIVSLPQNERIYLGGNENGTGEGTLILGEGGSINNVTNIFIGSARNGARGHLQMAGGTLTIQTPWPNSHHALLVGRISDTTGEQRAWGDISGFGTIARSMTDRSTRIKLYGQVVASGGDLNLASIKTIGEANVDANVCGTNGWYAVALVRNGATTIVIR